MRKTYGYLIALAVLARPAAADDSQSVSWQQAARRLSNAANVNQTPITWDALVFSGDGKTLAGAGDRPHGKPVPSGLPVPPSFDRAGLFEVWDLKNYRPTKAAYTTLIEASYADPRLRLHIALRISDNGKIVYGNLQTNDFQTDVLNKVDGKGRIDFRAHFSENSGIYLWELTQEYPALVRATEAPTSVFFLGSHLSQDRRHVLLGAPEGLQNYTIQTQQQVPQSKAAQQTKPKAAQRTKPRMQVPQLPGSRKGKRLVAKAQGARTAAPTKFQTPCFFSPDGSCFVSAEEGGGMLLWDVKAKKVRCRTGALAEGRAAVAAISRDNRRLFVASSSGRGGIRIYDTGDGQEIGQIGPLDTPVIDLSASADGESLAYCAGGLAYVHNALASTEIALPLGQGDHVTCIAISPDGLSAAGGGDDGAVRLWEAGPPRQSPVAQKHKDTEAPLVALGPRRATVTGGKGESQEMWLVRLTPGLALLRKTLGGKLLRVPAANGKVTQIAAGGTSWQLDPNNKVYVGPTLALPEQPDMNVAAQPASPEEENLHLLLGARRRLSALASVIEQPGNDESIREIRRQAEQLQSHLKGKPVPGPAIAAVYGDLARAVDELTQSEAKRREALSTLNQQAIEISHQRVRETDRKFANLLVGVGMALLGSMREQNYVGMVQHPAGGFCPVYEEVTIFPGLREAGMLHILGEVASSQQRQAQLKAAEQLGEAETGKALVAALELRETAIKRVQDGWQGVATRAFGLDANPPPPEDLPSKSRLAADLKPLVDALTEQMRRDRGRTSREDPFQFADVLFVKSLVRESAEADAENVFRQAREVAALVRQVPPGDIHNTDRATLLSLAATLVSRAVSLESGDCDPGEAYSEKAAFAVAVLDRALSLEPGDPAGRLGEQRVVALAQCGRGEDALEEARKLVAKHPDSASAHYQLARLECSAGNLNAGFDHLERALVKHGLRDLIDVRKRPEFPKNDDRFNDLIEFKLRIGSQVKGDTLGPIGNGRVTVYNASKVPLHNLGFRLEYRGTMLGDKGRLKSFVVETGLQRLAPGESYVIFTEPHVDVAVKATKDGRNRWLGGKLTVVAPQQGAEEFTVE